MPHYSRSFMRRRPPALRLILGCSQYGLLPPANGLPTVSFSDAITAGTAYLENKHATRSSVTVSRTENHMSRVSANSRRRRPQGVALAYTRLHRRHVRAMTFAFEQFPEFFELLLCAAAHPGLGGDSSGR
ncbi:MAG: hypothetical protein QOJ99_4356 [Bryobacterales bacterium]|jgi:hypothetical protein|nr:hypothetical protein [Bryobacterales bacterium]